MISLAADQAGLPASFVAHVSAMVPARQLDPLDADMRVMKAVGEVAGNFGGQSNLSKSMLSECCEFFKQKFSGLAPEEIVTAFRMAAARELDVDAALYGGNFNVERLGGVLAAYKLHRNKAMSAMEKAKAMLAGLEAEGKWLDWRETEAGRAFFEQMEADWAAKAAEADMEARSRARLLRLEDDAAKMRAQREESLTELVKLTYWEKQMEVPGVDEQGEPVTLTKWVMCQKGDEGAEVMRENWVRQDIGLAAYLRLVEFFGLFVTFDKEEAERVARAWGDVWREEWSDRHPLLKSRWKEYARAQAKAMRQSVRRSLEAADVLQRAASVRHPDMGARILGGKTRATLKKWNAEWPDALEGYMQRGIVPPLLDDWLLHLALLWAKENTGEWPTKSLIDPNAQGQQKTNTA